MELCYYCGCLDHGDKDYVDWLNNDSISDVRRKKYDSSIHVKPVYSSSKNVIFVPGFAESRNSREVKSSLLNKDRPQATATETTPSASHPVSIEMASENLGHSINADVANHTKSNASNSITDADPIQPNNDEEDFVERKEEIDKEWGRFEITEKDRVGPNMTTMTSGGPTLGSNAAGVKHTKWTCIVRPSSTHEDSYPLEHLGKRGSNCSSEENPSQKRKTQEATINSDNVFATMVADAQPHRLP